MMRVRGRRTWLAAVLLVVLGGAALVVGLDIRRVARIRAGVTVKQMCSCIFVAGRDEQGCRSDVPPLYDPVHVTVDHAAQAVQAWLPVLAERTATYREGFGCTLR